MLGFTCYKILISKTNKNLGSFNMETKYCHVCGMPIWEVDELYGTKKEGIKNSDYCKCCYDQGEDKFIGTI